MKKLKTFLITLCVCMLGAIALVACGSTSRPGHYVLEAVQTVTPDGQTIEQTIPDDVDVKGKMYIDINEDGTCVFDFTYALPQLGGQGVNGTWAENAEDPDKIDITYANSGEGGSDVVMTLVCKDGKLYLPIGGTENAYIFIK